MVRQSGAVDVGWLPDASERSVRAALAQVDPDLAVGHLVMTPKPEQENPVYWSGSATVDGTLVVKFAWAEAPAIRIWREGVLLERLGATEPQLPIPPVRRVSQRPALLATELVDGKPLSWEWANERTPDEASRLGTELGAFLARLHTIPAQRVLADLPTLLPAPQADTAHLRSRYPRLVDEHRARLVRRWCDWVDDALAEDTGNPGVLVHGDFHGYNQLWNHDSLELVAVVDFEQAGIAEREFDFRYLPGNSRSPHLTFEATAAYELHTERRLKLQRVLAWNVLSHLGDALWRTEADVPLPRRR